jgi:hypothetical protein
VGDKLPFRCTACRANNLVCIRARSRQGSTRCINCADAGIQCSRSWALAIAKNHAAKNGIELKDSRTYVKNKGLKKASNEKKKKQPMLSTAGPSSPDSPSQRGRTRPYVQVPRYSGSRRILLKSASTSAAAASEMPDPAFNFEGGEAFLRAIASKDIPEDVLDLTMEYFSSASKFFGNLSNRADKANEKLQGINKSGSS